MSHNLTLHIVASVPFSNLNRDDTGTPKRIQQGGVMRALHSSQAIKRGIRVRYEKASKDISVRSGKLDAAIAERVAQLAPELDAKTATKEAKNWWASSPRVSLKKVNQPAPRGFPPRSSTRRRRPWWIS